MTEAEARAIAQEIADDLFSSPYHGDVDRLALEIDPGRPCHWQPGWGKQAAIRRITDMLVKRSQQQAPRQQPSLFDQIENPTNDQKGVPRKFDPASIEWYTRRGKVLRLLSDNQWHTTAEIQAPDVGGSEGTRRLRELRNLGCPIEVRPVKGSTQYEYRLTIDLQPPPPTTKETPTHA